MPKAAKKSSNGPRHAPYDSSSKPSKGAKGATPGAHNIFKFNKDLGQHILKNPGVAQAIVDKADLKPSDIVLEIGPGTGNLTAKILEKAKRVIAVEMDPRMAAELTKRFQGTPAAKRLELILGDVIKHPALPYFDVCISNTPYQISSPLTFKLLALSPSPRACVLMFQREFAMRLFARPGEKLYSRLSVNAQMWATISHVMKVGKNNFNPPPQVESNVVKILPKNPRPTISYDEWDGLLRICFVRKNKTLRSGFLGTASVLDMIEANYKVFCAQNNVVLPEGLADPAAAAVMQEDDHDMEIDVDLEDNDKDIDDDDMPDFFKDDYQTPVKTKTPTTSIKKAKTKVGVLIRQKVEKVLTADTGLADKRARMCGEGDFLKLLYAFNQEGIHFH